MSTLTWSPWNMCGVQATLVNGETITVDGWSNGSGSKGGFALVYRFGRYEFTARADAYAAAELLNTALYLQSEDNARTALAELNRGTHLLSQAGTREPSQTVRRVVK